VCVVSSVCVMGRGVGSCEVPTFWADLQRSYARNHAPSRLLSNTTQCHSTCHLPACRCLKQRHHNTPVSMSSSTNHSLVVVGLQL
jgi:hypothetical protein